MGLDPPGVNLRVGYFAWAGWNHEDAWVVSQYAADKLESRTVKTREIPILALEAEPDFDSYGERVERPYELVRHRLSPAFLWPAFDKLQAVLKQMGGKQVTQLLKRGTCRLRSPQDEKLKVKGDAGVTVTVKDVESENLQANDGLEGGPSQTDGTCDKAEISPSVRQRYREVLRFSVEIARPLQPGDKLATRHGHKGIVGLILPDEQRPIWKGQPLDALIDPISVINRGNWGQLYETLAGAVAEKEGGRRRVDSEFAGESESMGEPWLRKFRDSFPDADDQGRSPIAVPAESCWFKGSGAEREFKAVAGCQFVMRMPQNASESISSGRTRVDFRSQLALWAHEGSQGTAPAVIGPLGESAKLSKAVEELRRLLWLAGVLIELDEVSRVIKVRRLRLDDPDAIPAHATRAKLAPGTKKKSMQAQLDELDPGGFHFVKLEPQPTSTPAAANSESSQGHFVSKRIPWQSIHWFPVASPKTIDAITEADLSMFPSTLSRRLVKLCKKLFPKKTQKGDSHAGRPCRQERIADSPTHQSSRARGVAHCGRIES